MDKLLLMYQNMKIIKITILARKSCSYALLNKLLLISNIREYICELTY